MTPHRSIAAAVVLGAVLASLSRFVIDRGSMDLFLGAIYSILVFFPLKGALLFFLAGRRPYWSALAANASSEFLGLGFPLSQLGMPWPALPISVFTSTLIEAATLTAMGTAGARASLLMSLYANVVVHLIVASLVLWPSGAIGATAVFLLSFALFLLPIFVVDRTPRIEPMRPRERR